MPGAVTLTELVTRVRYRSDMENSTFCSDAEIQEYIEQSTGALMDLCIDAGATTLFALRTGDTANVTVAGTEAYDIYVAPEDPALIYRILQVQVQLNGKWRRIRPLPLSGYADYQDSTSWGSASDIRYSFGYSGVSSHPSVTTPFQRVTFYPTPPSEYYFRVLYVPYPLEWSDDGTYLFQGLSGWDEWIVCDAAAKCLEKEESSADHLYLRMQRLEDRIRYAIQNMNLDEVGRVRNIDLDHRDYWDE